jgi:aminoglycoside 6-adenylyltransferase
MRSEAEVLDALVAWAERSDNILALRMTGSRGNSTGISDDLSDYDIEVFVRDRTPFVTDDSWIHTFGEVMVRWPLRPSPTFGEAWITQLVLYCDGIRIDFQITDRAPGEMPSLGGAYRVLADKEKAFTEQMPEENPFRLRPPDEAAYMERVNAFWWDIVYVPKALCRDELNLAKRMLEGTIRFDKLQPLIEWYIGVTAGWDVHTGLSGRYFKRYLSPDLWQQYERTFAGATLDDNWQALFATIDFTRTVATAVAQAMSFEYPSEIDVNVTAYITALHDQHQEQL